MIFTKNSALVKVWVGNVQSGLYTKEQVPKIFNLQEVVWEVLEESTK
ncbi:hypothetical protein [Cellulosilyticum lentocellum]|uniref:Uncharacterized protein n=1 Tax=Cellulosilyticum lentocellum (strain ATCC 49066 / DSM 5427 / NCIMB 11756 / RHM5) TaxID=642492 RepID=F2JPE3_CELLD|nr:hypothetical protein [Cellulosilyticum lentocellum]ADZ82491.1 hypothetical protein Clole_0758 [Cellulosilyticum lentocellum DSM 5427]